jgi:hypothetical protein
VAHPLLLFKRLNRKSPGYYLMIIKGYAAVYADSAQKLFVDLESLSARVILKLTIS